MAYDLREIARRAGVRRRTVALRPIEPPRGLESSYRRVLRAMLSAIAAHVRDEILPAVERERQGLVRDEAGDRIGGLFAGMRQVVERLSSAADLTARRIFEAEADRHTARFVASIRQAIGVDMGAMLRASPGLEERISLAAMRNAQLIRGLADDVQRRIAETVTRSLTQGGTARDLRAELQSTFGIEGRRAELIARNESANLTSQLNQYRQTEAGIQEYVWRTSQDERVREEHAALEGTTHRWDQPGPDDGQHAGEPVNCRCTAQAVIRLD